MAVTDISEVRKKRKIKKIKRALKKLLIFLLAAFLVLLVFLSKNRWYPYLDGILSKIPSAENTGELAVGNFPIEISDENSYQLKIMENNIAVLNDSCLNIYTDEGKQLLSVQHDYAKPIIEASSKRALIYDLGGKCFSLYSKYDKIYEKTDDNTILFAKLSSNDYAAVVTKSEKYLALLTVYNSKGESVFVYKSYDSRIIDVTFNRDNNGCIITTIGAKGGELVSQLLYYKFDETDMIWQSDYINTMAFSTRLYGESGIILFGDNKCGYFDNNGKLTASYDYDYSIVDFDSSDTLSGMLFNNEETRKSVLVLMDNIENKPIETVIDGTAENIDIFGDIAYVQTSKKIYAYSKMGEIVSSVDLESDYQNFCKTDNYIFLMGYNEINRIDYK
jgi:hypothetical protein